MRGYGLLGRTLKHSFSKNYFANKFQSLGITDCYYENFELADINELPQLLKDNPTIKGLNVTIPYKEDILPFLNFKNDIVQEVKACNCIKINDGLLWGYNTDVIGFQQSLEKHRGPQHKNALILGTGGAAKAVQYSLNLLGISFLNVSRRKTEDTITYQEIDMDILNSYTLIINTSPLGMFPKTNEAPPMPYKFITRKHLLFDLIYNPEETMFLKKGKAVGAKTANGYEMLILQAEESWRIWND